MADEPGTPHSNADAPPTAKEKRHVPVRIILLVALGIYLVLVAALNSRTEEVSFVFFSVHISLIVALVLVAVLGFVAGYLTNELRDRRKRKTQAKV